MTIIVVPLAGPDIYEPDIKPMRDVRGSPLLLQVLSGRPWIAGFSEDADQLVFVLRDDGADLAVLSEFIRSNFPGAALVTVTQTTAGACFSAMAGVALSRVVDQPVIIDLADISFSLDEDVARYFSRQAQVRALVPYFDDSDCASTGFSYLQMNGASVVKAREKDKISANASAGVYAFRDLGAFNDGLAWVLGNPDASSVNGIYYICPMVNGLIGGDTQVHGVAVSNVESFS